MAGRSDHRGFGYIRRLPSDRYQASYVGPDLARHSAAQTFEAKGDAEAWLATERVLINTEKWSPPKARVKLAAAEPLTFRAYAESWLIDRDLKPRTRAHYRSLLDRFILPTFGDIHPNGITPAAVRVWHSTTAGATPTLRAHAYALLRAILTTAVHDELTATNPCHIRAAGNSKRQTKVEPASLPELAALTAAMPVKYRLMVLIAAWCALRFGELTELRRKDIDLKRGVIHVRRGVTWVDSTPIVGLPKTEAGIRDVAIPPHLLPAVREHLRDHAGIELLFPSPTGCHLTTSTFYASFWPARKKAGRPDLRFHHLRHTGAVLAASTGATLVELMARLGHSTPAAAMRYQHAARGRDAEIAAALSNLATRAADQ